MRSSLATLALLFASPAAAQEPASAPPAASGGLTPRWQIETLAASIADQTAELSQLLAQVRPQEWLEDGAPAAYVQQHAELASNLDSLSQSARALGTKPERLSYVVDTFLWLDRLRSMLSSIISGVRRYQSPALADLLDSALSRNNSAVEPLKAYLRELAVAAEEEMEVVHAEAQRCRAELMRRPPTR